MMNLEVTEQELGILLGGVASLLEKIEDEPSFQDSPTLITSQELQQKLLSVMLAKAIGVH